MLHPLPHPGGRGWSLTNKCPNPCHLLPLQLQPLRLVLFLQPPTLLTTMTTADTHHPLQHHPTPIPTPHSSPFFESSLSRYENSRQESKLYLHKQTGLVEGHGESPLPPTTTLALTKKSKTGLPAHSCHPASPAEAQVAVTTTCTKEHLCGMWPHLLRQAAPAEGSRTLRYSQTLGQRPQRNSLWSGHCLEARCHRFEGLRCQTTCVSLGY